LDEAGIPASIKVKAKATATRTRHRIPAQGLASSSSANNKSN